MYGEWTTGVSTQADWVTSRMATNCLATGLATANDSFLQNRKLFWILVHPRLSPRTKRSSLKATALAWGPILPMK